MNESKKNTRTLIDRTRKLAADTRGAGLVEYIILVGLIALVAISGFEYFGDKVNSKARGLGDEVTGIGAGSN